jgi:pimeloyl-ACP methyl ester carboxylesterase
MRWVLLFGFVGWWLAGTIVLSPRRRPMRPAPYGYVEVSLQGPRGHLDAWLTGDTRVPDVGCALVLHGNGSDRLAMVSTAREWRHLGFAVLLLDLSAHGSSAGWGRGLGFHEQHDVAPAVQWLRAAGCRGGVVVHGFSLGAAAAVLSASDHGADAVIAEATFEDLDGAAHRRMATFVGDGLASVITPVLLAQVPIRFGASAAELCPRCEAEALDVPALFLGGDADPRVPVSVTESFGDAGHDVAVFSGLGHATAATEQPLRWRSEVGGFLQRQGLPRSTIPDDAVLADHVPELIEGCELLLGATPEVRMLRSLGGPPPPWRWFQDSRLPNAIGVPGRVKRLHELGVREVRPLSSSWEDETFCEHHGCVAVGLDGCAVDWNGPGTVWVRDGRTLDATACRYVGERRGWTVEVCER